MMTEFAVMQKHEISNYYCDGKEHEILFDNKVVGYEYTGYVKAINLGKPATCYVSLWDAYGNFTKLAKDPVKEKDKHVYIATITNVTARGFNYANGKIKHVIMVIDISQLNGMVKNARGDIALLRNGLYHSEDPMHPSIIYTNGNIAYYFNGTKIAKYNLAKVYKTDESHAVAPANAHDVTYDETDDFPNSHLPQLSYDDIHHVIPSDKDPIYNPKKKLTFAEITINYKFCKVVGCTRDPCNHNRDKPAIAFKSSKPLAWANS
jgi:hypothetical protein